MCSPHTINVATQLNLRSISTKSMRKLLKLLVFLLVGVSAYSGSASAAMQKQYVAVGTTTAPYGFIRYLPSNYSSPPVGGWPAIVFLHGAGETGGGTTNATTGLPKVETQGLPNEITNNGKEIGAVVLCPQNT